MLARALILLSAISLASSAGAQGGEIFPYRVHEHRLENGLKVVTIPYGSPGIVAYFSVVRTGSRNEVEPGHSGFAHFFEHMMFRGTERYPTAEYNDILKRMGADTNAFTTDDYTGYYIVGPSSELATMMEIEADRFKNLKYSEEAFRTEALAVLGEYNKSASNPFLPMIERLRALAFKEHTYRHTTIGFLEDIKAMPGYYGYSLRFFDRYYRPENTILLVVGDVDPERVKAMAERFYGDWKAGYEPVEIPSEPPQEEAKRDHLAWPNPTRPYLMIGYRAPAFSTDTVTMAALDVTSQLLFAESAPLYQELVVEKQWVDFVSGGAQDHRDPYLFTIASRVKSDELLPKVEQTIEEHIGRLREEPVDAQRLERIKSHLRYDFALGLDSPGSVAFRAAHYLNLTGDVQTINRLFEQYQKVTPADVQKVGKEVFHPQGRTVVTLAHPQKEVVREGR